MKPLNGAEIVALVCGRRIVPSLDKGQAAPPFAETFHADHKWSGTLQSFELKMISGAWSIKGDELCVTPAGERPECRQVWRAAGTDHILIKSLSSFSSGDGLLTVAVSAIHE